MKEIRFRLWNKEMGMYWFDLSWGSRHNSGEGWLYAVPVGEDRKPGGIRPDNRVNLSPDEVDIMQFTGLHDRNGREIYEGDIWQREGYTGEVVWSFSAWDFERAGSKSAYSYPYFHSNAVTGEVIGNIYESPELLK
jgi:uncharacterized phage protein (TIGR01671 family)